MIPDLPAAVTAMLATRIQTFEKLEIVVALHGTQGAAMSIEALCRTLKLPRDLIRQATMELRASALVELTRQGEIRLSPPTEAERAAVADLARLYAEDRVMLVVALGEIAMDRIRGMASRTFAAAFVLRKPKDSKDGDDG